MNANPSIGRTARYTENNGHYWLASYIVPLIVGITGVVVFWLTRHHVWRGPTAAPGMLVLATLLACSLAAAALGLISILRKEMNSYYAFQPFICGFLVFVFAAAWACM